MCAEPLHGVVDEVGVGVLIGEVAMPKPGVPNTRPLWTVASGEGAGPMGSEAFADEVHVVASVAQGAGRSERASSWAG